MVSGLPFPSRLTPCHNPHSVADAASLPDRGESFLKVGGFGSPRKVWVVLLLASPLGELDAKAVREGECHHHCSLAQGLVVG